MKFDSGEYINCHLKTVYINKLIMDRAPQGTYIWVPCCIQNLLLHSLITPKLVCGVFCRTDPYISLKWSLHTLGKCCNIWDFNWCRVNWQRKNKKNSLFRQQWALGPFDQLVEYVTLRWFRTGKRAFLSKIIVVRNGPPKNGSKWLMSWNSRKQIPFCKDPNISSIPWNLMQWSTSVRITTITSLWDIFPVITLFFNLFFLIFVQTLNLVCELNLLA